jgi:hypothetical protein
LAVGFHQYSIVNSPVPKAKADVAELYSRYFVCAEPKSILPRSPSDADAIGVTQMESPEITRARTVEMMKFRDRALLFILPP